MEDAKFVLGVDLDGVVADFYEGIRALAAEWLEVDVSSLTPEVSYGLPEWNIAAALGGYKAFHRFAVTQRDLFRNLKPIPGAALSIRRLSVLGVRIRIITHRLYIKHFHQTAVQQTIDWLDDYDIPYWDLCFMKDKAGVGADLYVEDTPQNVQALRDDGHDVLVFTNSTNRDVPSPRANTWREVEQYVQSALNDWRAEGRDKRQSPGR